MKKLLLTILLATLFFGLMSPAIAEHNDEFPTNGCDTADQTINVTATGEILLFEVDGEENPEVNVDSGACVEVIFDNVSDLDHDFTVVDDVTDPENELEIIHMDTDSKTKTRHLWLMPDYEVELNYFCEVPGHQGGGMEGVIKIGATSALPGFGFAPAFLALTFLIAIPVMKSRKN